MSQESQHWNRNYQTVRSMISQGSTFQESDAGDNSENWILMIGDVWYKDLETHLCIVEDYLGSWQNNLIASGLVYHISSTSYVAFDENEAYVLQSYLFCRYWKCLNM